LNASQVLEEGWHVKFDKLRYLKVLQVQLWDSLQSMN